MSQHTRRILTPGASRKRKDREAFYSFKPSPTTHPPPPLPTFPATNSATAAAALPDSSNRLLAGYLAYEFLTKGTLFGQKYDPARARAVQLSGSLAEPRKVKPEAEPSPKKENQGYAEVANILKTDEAHIQGIVNPAQLAHWIKM
ncbi:hypothetical protein SLEP1_g58669 [Rubroshorea leprosula]|uniref:Embryo sac development arrest 6 n=1 Tax=Rubroshorea leprosula TaxID=152421 RepID=A0AAV5MR79_9ROSI|nr:hypothetical protein SLEP1_g58669 [Rubroshorea leprosula]